MMRIPSAIRLSALFAALAFAIMPLRAVAAATDDGEKAYERGDYAAAIAAFEKAAAAGDADAQFNLGVMYEAGQGVAQDHARALAWWLKAAEQGHDGAQYNLGLTFQDGRGVPRSLAEAAKWYAMAATANEANAQNALALLYERGDGVQRDYVQAYMLYDLAAAQEHAAAGINREMLSARMTAAEIAEAGRLARAWRQKYNLPEPAPKSAPAARRAAPPAAVTPPR
jgi:hypothetical protein